MFILYEIIASQINTVTFSGMNYPSSTSLTERHVVKPLFLLMTVIQYKECFYILSKKHLIIVADKNHAGCIGFAVLSIGQHRPLLVICYAVSTPCPFVLNKCKT